jgi:C-terminal processing protease CtpA/Prc
VVIVDKGTVSAAEIVAGALQDHGRALIVGTTTAGQGTILSGYDLADDSQLWIGEAEWRTPDGDVVWRHGLAPDIEVALPPDAKPLWAADIAAMSEAEIAASGDAQLLRAIELATLPPPPDSDTETVGDSVPGTDGAEAITFAFLLFFGLGGVIAWQAVVEYRAPGARYR